MTTSGGDTFSNISNATIINRSLVMDSMNKARGIGGEELARVLESVGLAIEQSGNREAGELFNHFNEELQRPEPRKSILKNAWDSIVSALPTVTAAAGATGAIAKLFT